MARYVIDGERSRVEVGTRPGLAGLHVVVSGIEGEVEATFTDDGVDLERPLHGSFSKTVEDLVAGNSLVAPAVHRWLGDRSTFDVRGELTEVRAHDDRRYDVLFTVDVADHSVPLKGLGRVRARPDGSIELDGTTIADPRAFGLALPPLLNLMAHTRWRLTLVPAPA